MMEKVMLNRDTILDFQTCSHVLSICYLKCHFWKTVYSFMIQNGYVMMSPANQLQGQGSFLQLIGC